MVDLRVGFLFMLLIGFGSTDAQRPPPRNLHATALAYHDPTNHVFRKDFRSDELCALCEEYAEIVLDYLVNNTTETEITEILNFICSLLGSFEELCTTLVDYLTTLLFSELSSVDADTFCQDVGVCSEGALVTSLRMKENRRKPCQDMVSDALTRLRNSDTQMDIVHALLKACDSRKNYPSQCKKTILERAPLLISNTALFLETHDACVTVPTRGAPFALAKPAPNMLLPLSSDS